MFSKASSLHLLDEKQEEGLVERMMMGREEHPYHLEANGVVKSGRGKPLAQLHIRAAGSPVSLGAQGSGSTSGEIQFKWMEKNQKPCKLKVTSFEMGLDDDPSSRDVRVTGQGSCGTISITAVDNNDKVTITFGSRTVSGKMTGGVTVLQPAVYDNGFYNIGVRPTSEDLAVGGTDPFGKPLSFSRQYIRLLLGKKTPDELQVNECTFEIKFNPLIDVFFFPGGFDPVPCKDGSVTYQPSNNQQNKPAIRKLRVAVDGATKVPTLRNVELNGPFFRNGGLATLGQVVSFYNRGGDFANRPNKDPDIRPLGMSKQEQDDLVAFMKSLTDDRVRCKRAPFDHPQLQIPLGHPGNHVAVTDEDQDFQGDDSLQTLDAVGAGGVTDCLGPFSP